jgi:hypothetical protein
MPRRGLRTLSWALGSLSWALCQWLGWALGLVGGALLQRLGSAYGPLSWTPLQRRGWTHRPLSWALLRWPGWTLSPLRRAFQPLRGNLGGLGEALEALDPRLGPPESGLGLLGSACGVLGGMLGRDRWTHIGDVPRRTRIAPLRSGRLAAEPVPESGRRTPLPLPPDVSLG